MSGWSRSFLSPSLASALEAGGTFEDWLGGRIPGVDYARISAAQSTRSAVVAKGREAGTGIRHQHEENAETAAALGVAIVRHYEDNGVTAVQPAAARPAFAEMVGALHCRRTTEGYPVQALIATEHERVWRLPADFDRVRQAVRPSDRQAVTVTEDGLFIERGAVFDLRSYGSAGNSAAGSVEVWKTKERIERHRDAPAGVEEWKALAELSRQRGANRGTRLTNGSPPPGREPQSVRKYLFSGYLRCGAERKDGTACNAKMGGCARPTDRNPGNAVYMCTALDCGGTARNVQDVDGHLEEIVLSLLSRRHEVVGPRQPEWAGTALLQLLVGQRASLEEQLRRGVFSDTGFAHEMAGLEPRISGLEAAREEHHGNRRATAAGRDPSRWPGMSLDQRRAAIAGVLESVTVLPLPLPPGQSRRAPFDPGLLRIRPVDMP
ncbi:hypothetical protein [Streptomyces canus]|uniref:hypothetical protein n=1 Tax=Streptomyces canus TaxID=58343 RepID=UPI0036EA5C67